MPSLRNLTSTEGPCISMLGLSAEARIIRAEEPTEEQTIMTDDYVRLNNLDINAEVAVSRDDQRLEFLGDKVLGLVIAEWLYELFPKESEADISRRFMALTSREALARVALERNYKSNSKRLLADVMEVNVGKIYRESKLEGATLYVRRRWRKIMAEYEHPPIDAKTRLNEIGNRKGLKVEYVQSSPKEWEEWAEHSPRFVITAKLGEQKASGSGGTKREAEQSAAGRLIDKLS